MSRAARAGDADLVVLLIGGTIAAAGLAGDLVDHVTQSGASTGLDRGWLLVLSIGVVVSTVGAVWTLVRRRPEERCGIVPAVGVVAAVGGLVGHEVMPSVVDGAPRTMALVSPAHLLLVTGLALVLLTPAATVWVRPVRSPRLGESVLVGLPAVLLLITVNLLTGHSSALIGGITFDIGWTEPLAGESIAELDVVRALAQILWLTVTIALVHGVLLRRFRPFPGTILAGFVLLAVVPVAIGGTETGPLATGLLAAGALMEIAVSLQARPVLGAVTAPVTIAASTAVLWATSFVVLDLDDRLAWPTTLCVGAIATAALLAAGAAVITGLRTDVPSAAVEPVPKPPPAPGPGRGDGSREDRRAPSRRSPRRPPRRSIDELLEEYDDEDLFTSP